jgi:CubicO group peptidase (beta-lactamase class C family)
MLNLPMRSFRISFLIPALLAAFFSNATAQSLPHLTITSPEEIGLSSARLERVDRVIQGYIDRKEAAGAVGLVARRGKIAYLKSWGEQDRQAGTTMADDTIFRIYSMSKPITAVAVMMLYEEGHFTLNDPVAKFLPELATMQVQTETQNAVTKEVTTEEKPAKRLITIRDLLRHTAGFSYGVFGNTMVDQQYREAGILTEDKTLEEMVTKLGKIPLRFEPATHWHYSISVDVAGRLVEVVSGMSFDQFLQQRMFAPLGMQDTGFVVPQTKADRFSVLYTPKGGPVGRDAFLKPSPKTKEIEPLVSNDLANFQEGTTFFSGGGGLVSTAHDYLLFCQMMLNGGQLNGTRLLSRKSVELMTTSHMHNITGFGGNGETFGLSFAILDDLGKGGDLGTEGTYDWGGAAGTKFWIDPEEELIGIFMVQILPHRTRMGDEFRTLTYQAIDD